MRRAALVVATAVLTATALADAPPASAGAAEDPVTTAVCDLLATPGCAVVVDPLESLLTELQDTAGVQPEPAPAPSTEPAPESAGPTPTDPASGGTATSSSASGPTSFAAAATPAGSPTVPGVPVGGTLELGPLGLPRYSFSAAPAMSAEDLAAAADASDRMGRAVSAAVTPERPDGSRATAVAMAFSMLMLACGLLLDQVRKARVPIRL